MNERQIMDVDKENLLSLSLANLGDGRLVARKAEYYSSKGAFGSLSKSKTSVSKEIEQRNKKYEDPAPKASNASAFGLMVMTESQELPRTASAATAITEKDGCHYDYKELKRSNDMLISSVSDKREGNCAYSIGKKQKLMVHVKEEPAVGLTGRNASCVIELDSKDREHYQPEISNFLYRRQQLEDSEAHDTVNFFRQNTFYESVGSMFLDPKIKSSSKCVTQDALLGKPLLQNQPSKNYNQLPLGVEIEHLSTRHLRETVELNLGSLTAFSSSEEVTRLYPNPSGGHVSLNSHQYHPLKPGVGFAGDPHPPKALTTFSSGGPSLPQSFAKAKNQGNMQPAGSDWGKFLALSNKDIDQSKKETEPSCHTRFQKLQAFQKSHEKPNDNIIRAICSLSADGRSELAVELERRAIALSIIEVQELQRMKTLDVFGKGFNKAAINYAGATPREHRIPA